MGGGTANPFAAARTGEGRGRGSLIRAITMLVGECGCVRGGAAGVGDRRLCQASGGWVRRSRVRSTSSLRLGTDRAQRRS